MLERLALPLLEVCVALASASVARLGLLVATLASMSAAAFLARRRFLCALFAHFKKFFFILVNFKISILYHLLQLEAALFYYIIQRNYKDLINKT